MGNEDEGMEIVNEHSCFEGVCCIGKQNSGTTASGRSETKEVLFR